ncbi:hypothetical protein G7Y89_g11181 [Cudoniella acicularis]|uniref:Peptidase M61 catalytic domain-containing protein n=1 Tax=Cudoniella acicularis TaxID=354080 RepID=A0A8H4RCU0_9HELO|nr:hypothetical protein G7Y89_g11181 [Cudoniella acicularis]
MASSKEPKVHLKITPEFNSLSEVYRLSIVLAIESAPLEEGSTVVAFPHVVKETCIRESELLAFDDNGELPVVIKDSTKEAGLAWIAGRNTTGNINLQYFATPSSAASAPGKPDLSLRCDQGGVLGSGLSFIPIPPGASRYRNVVEWDLSNAPSGTRAIWTFGEGPDVIERIGPASFLNDSVYMVGPVQSHPTKSTADSISEYYGYYWFGNLPSNIEVIKDMHHAFFLKVAEVFFDDSPSIQNPHRSFVRKTPTSFGGTSFNHSHIFDYDNQINQATDYDLVRRLAHETVHHWLGGSVTDERIDWFYEGVRNVLSVYLPFRSRFRSGDYFSSTINVLCTKYYTNPLIHLPQAELLKAATSDFYARELVSSRAWAFVVGVDLRARRMSKLIRPIEDLAIKPLVKKKANGEPHGLSEFVALLQPLMGEEIDERYEHMLKGSTILLPPEMFGAKTHRLIPKDQEILDFGFHMQSFDEGIVMDLKSGSRAQQAGLKDEDKILSSSHISLCVDNFESEMEVVIERQGLETRIKYWPRAFEKAGSWHMVKVEAA